MLRSTFASASAAVVLGAALLLAAAAWNGVAFARPDTGDCYLRILTEPSHTRGRSNTIRWEAVPSHCWKSASETANGKKSTDRRFVVTITTPATAAKTTVTVRGQDETAATVGPDDFPGGAIDGQQFSYRLARKEKWCIEGSVIPGIDCADYGTSTIESVNNVWSTQDDRPPTGSLVLAGGTTFVSSLEMPAAVTAADPGANASGPGYVAFGGSGRRSGCGVMTACAEPIRQGMTVRLEPGPDGIRTVEARVYDRARGPADDPGETTIGMPPGNVSASFQDTIFVDRTAPYVYLRISSVRVTVGTPVTFDASQTSEQEGSGVSPGTAAWRFGDGASARNLVATHAYARTGKYTVGFSVQDWVGNVARSAPVELEVVAAAVPPQPQTTETPPAAPAPTTVDRKPPTLSALAVRRRGGRAIVAFRVSERAVVRFEVRRVLPRPVRRLASLSRQLAAGRRSIVLPAASTRKSGRYAILLVARDRAGNVSRAHTLRLTTR